MKDAAEFFLISGCKFLNAEPGGDPVQKISAKNMFQKFAFIHTHIPDEAA